LGADALRVISEGENIFVIPNDLGQSITSSRRIIHPPAVLTTESATLGQLNTAISNLDAEIDILLALKVDKTSVGVANGVASLDAGGKVPLSQIPDSIIGQVQYMGTWNALTNTPTLNFLVPEEKGHYYVVSVAGVFGGIDFQVGDWIISNGSYWEKVDNTDAVTSVFGRIGAILSLEADYQSFYPRLSQAYDNPTWINSLAFSKITGVPPFLLENQTITLSGDVTGSGKTSISTTISDNSVTDSKLRNSVGTSVIGRAANSTGDPADIQASTDGHVLLRSSGNLLFGLISSDSISSINWSKITGTPTTLSGYGITDAYTKTESDNKFVPYTGANANVNLGSNNITANSFIKAGGTSSQFLKADGSVDTSQYVPTTRSINAGTGLTGGGNLSSDVNISFDTTWGDTRYAYRTRQLTINGVTYDLSADRTWSVGTVTSISTNGPITGGIITGSGTIGITQSSASTDGYLSSTDWNTFNNKQPAGDYVTIATDQTITGLKTIVRSGDVLNFKIGTDTLYGLKVAYNQNELVPSGEATWSFVNTFNRDGVGYSVTPLSFFRGVLVTGERLISSSVNANLLDYYSNNPTGRYPVYAYNTGVQQFSESILVGYNTGLVNAVTGAIASLPSGVVANFNGRVIGSNAVNSNEFATLSQLTGGTVTSVGLSMPPAFTVSNSPVTSTSVSYYLNGSVNQGTFVGNTYYEMNKVPIFGAGTDFNINTNGYIAQFITDANDPDLLLIPGGNWNLEFYFSASSGGGSPTFYVELYKYDGTTFTLIASNSTNPELISLGTTINPYFSTLGVPETVLAATDRLAIRIYVTNAGRTITLHTENSHLCQVITTFTTGLTALNGITKQVQYLTTGTSGTDFNIVSSVDTHTFNLPTASAINRGALSSADWTTFNNKQATISLTTTGSSGSSTFISNVLNVPTYTLSGLGGVPTSRTITINGTTQDLSVDRTYSVGTVTSVAALTLGTSGTDLSSSVANGTTTPVITLNVPTASASNRGVLSAADWSTFNSKQNTITLTTTGTSGAATLIGATLNIPQYQAAGTYVTAVTASSPLASSGGTTPNITIQQASGSQNGFLSSTDWSTFNNKQNALTNPVTGTGTTNYLPKFTGSTTIGNSIVQEGGAGILISGTDNFTSQNGGWFFNGSGNYASGIFASSSSNILTLRSPQNISFQIGFSTPSMTLTSGGNLLVGTTTDIGQRLQVSGGYITQVDGGVRTFLGYDGIGSLVGTTTNHYFRFITNDTERMRITSGGNIGIGTSSPSFKLDVNGKIYSSTEVQGGSALMNLTGGYATFGSNSSVVGIRVGRDASLNDIIINPSGNVAIGTTTDAGFKLDVNGTGRFSASGSTNLVVQRTGSNGVFMQLLDASGNSVFLGGNNGDFQVQTPSGGFSNKLVVTNTGNVGIGTTSPQVAGGGYTGLHINGSGSSLVLSTSGANLTYLYTLGTGGVDFAIENYNGQRSKTKRKRND